MSAIRLLTLAFAALAVAVLAACGGDDDDSGDTVCVPTSGAPTPAPSQPPDVDGDVVTTASGLQYVDICVGSGISPMIADEVSLYFTTWLQADGTKWDSSVDAGAPRNLSVESPVAGLTEGLLTMREGGRRRLVIPPELAFGEEGFPGLVPPNSTLVFDVELVAVLGPLEDLATPPTSP